MATPYTPVPPDPAASDPYADAECRGCLAGEDCDGWTTETLKCPSRRWSDRYLDAALDDEDDAPFGAGDLYGAETHRG